MDTMLFEAQVYQQCVDRVNKLTPETPAGWGKMDVAQMLAHCTEILAVANGKTLDKTPFFAKLFKGMIRKMVVNDKPYKKNLQTHPQYRIVDAKQFDAEKKRLLQAMATFRDENKDGPSKHVHSLFGKMTHAEKGWSMYKHLDYHLAQFGA